MEYRSIRVEAASTMNNPPVFSEATATRSVPENTGAEVDFGTAVTATDANSDGTDLFPGRHRRGILRHSRYVRPVADQGGPGLRDQEFLRGDGYRRGPVGRH